MVASVVPTQHSDPDGGGMTSLGIGNKVQKWDGCDDQLKWPSRRSSAMWGLARPGQSRRRSEAQRVSSCREESWSLRSTLDMWVSTVLIEMNSSFATSL